MLAALIIGVIAPSIASAQKTTNNLKGQKAPPISLETVDGKRMELADFKGCVVVIDYWATWCGPCRMSLPHLQKLHAEKSLFDRGLRVFAINKLESADKVKPFLEKNEYTFVVPLDIDGKFAGDYFVRGLPVTIIIGRDGRIRNVFIGYGKSSDAKLDDAIAKALDQNVPN